MQVKMPGKVALAAGRYNVFYLIIGRQRKLYEPKMEL